MLNRSNAIVWIGPLRVIFDHLHSPPSNRFGNVHVAETGVTNMYPLTSPFPVDMECCFCFDILHAVLDHLNLNLKLKLVTTMTTIMIQDSALKAAATNEDLLSIAV